MQGIRKTIFATLLALLLFPWQSYAEQATAQPLSTQALQQLVAPIALYPDPLLAQILMASTYPLEVVSAARWLKDNNHLKGKALEDALQQQTWDPSVKSLTAVPDVLNMMNEKLDMTTKLGDAFLAQQNDVLNAVQALRHKAQAAGNLNSNKQQVVNTAQNTENNSQSNNASYPIQNIISIEPADPQVVYVPMYDPNVVYGTWSYPEYPPYYYPYSGYAAGMALSFGAGYIVGDALWGRFDWHNHGVDINVNEFNRYNHTNIDNPNWRHDPAHRAGVPYRDLASQEKYGKGQLQDNQARDAFRGRAEAGRQELQRDGQAGIQNMERTGERREAGMMDDEQRFRDPMNRSEREQRGPVQQQRINPEERRPGNEGGQFRAYEGLQHGEENLHHELRGHDGLQGGRGEFRGGEGGFRGGEGGGFHGGGGRGGRR